MNKNDVEKLRNYKQKIKLIKEEIKNYYEKNKEELDFLLLEYNYLKKSEKNNCKKLEKYLRKNIILLKYNYLISYLKFYEEEVRKLKDESNNKIKTYKK